MAQRPKSIMEMFDEDIDELNLEDEEEFQQLDYQQFGSSAQDQFGSSAQDQLTEIVEEPEESLESQMLKDNSNNIFDGDYELPVLILDDNSQLSECSKIKLGGFKNYVKRQNLQNQQIEQQFNQIVKEQAEKLLQEKKQEEIMKKVQKQTKPSKLQEKISEMLAQPTLEPMEIERKTQTIQQKPKKHDDSEEILKLKQLINDYKVRYNQDQDLIKTLKLSLQKLEVNTSRDSCSTKASLTDDIKCENEKLKQEIIVLKKQFFKENEQLKQQISKTLKIQQGIQQQKQKDQQVPDVAKQEIAKIQAEMTQQGCQFRNKINELQSQIQEKDKKIQKLEAEIKKMEDQKDKPDQQQKQIMSLKESNEKLQQEIVAVKEKYMLDNQLKLLFPTQQENLLKAMNIFLVLENQEKVKRYVCKTAYSYVQPFFKKIIEKIEWAYSMIKYKWTKQIVHHPDNKQVLLEAMKQIRANPTNLENENRQMKKELNSLSSENTDLRGRLQKLQTEYDEKCSIYSQFEEIVKVDKIKLANQLMMRILKKEAEDRQTGEQNEQPELQLVKEYCDLILKSTNVKQQPAIQKQQTKPKQEIKSTCTVVVKKCVYSDRHQKRDEKPTKGMYYNK